MGAVVGRKYRLVRKIGAGGMGEVWIAVNETTGAEVAVKRVREDRRGDAAARFRHEARLGAMLAHRGIVRIFNLVEEDGEGALLLVMELLKGETLERHLERRGPLATREALAIALPLLSALAHAHARGVVHRDVTPANVFLAVDPDGFVGPKLLDFGIARVPSAAERHTVDGKALGTPRYMAPERVREQDGLDGRSNLFSVGAVLYEMLTGVCPFAASTPAASLAAVLEAVVDPDSRIDARLWVELRRALAKQPYERPESAEAMAHALLAAAGETDASLAEALRGAPIVADEPAPASSNEGTRTVGGHSMGAPAGDARSARRRAWAIAATAFVVGGAVTLWTARRTPSPPPAAATAIAPPPPVALPRRPRSRRKAPARPLLRRPRRPRSPRPRAASPRSPWPPRRDSDGRSSCRSPGCGCEAGAAVSHGGPRRRPCRGTRGTRRRSSQWRARSRASRRRGQS